MSVLNSLDRLDQRLSAMKAAGEPGTFEETIYSGRTVTWRLVRIPAADVEAKTRVWGGNERCADLLSARALEDITSTLGEQGNTEWARGRVVNGMYEVGDGSRRLAGCILKERPYNLLVADLTDAEMDWYSAIGNRYNPPSAWEKGKRYQRLEKQLGSQRALETHLQDLGERVSRRTISRCIDTSQLPKEIMLLFSQPGYLTPAQGSALHDRWASMAPDQQDALLLAAIDFHPNPDDQRDPDDEMLAFLMHWAATVSPAPVVTPVVRNFKHGKITLKGGRVSVSAGQGLSLEQREWLMEEMAGLLAQLEQGGDIEKP